MGEGSTWSYRPVAAVQTCTLCIPGVPVRLSQWRGLHWSFGCFPPISLGRSKAVCVGLDEHLGKLALSFPHFTFLSLFHERPSQAFLLARPSQICAGV